MRVKMLNSELKWEILDERIVPFYPCFHTSFRTSFHYEFLARVSITNFVYETREIRKLVESRNEITASSPCYTKELAVIFQLVNLTGRVEVPSPFAFTFGIRPSRCSDTQLCLIGHPFLF